MIGPGILTLAATLIVAGTTAAGGEADRPARSGPAADIVFQDMIPTGRQVTVSARTDYIEVVSVRIIAKADHTRVNLIVRFSSRQVDPVRMLVTLTDPDGAVLGQVEHMEPVGPETVVSEYARGLHWTRAWDDPRSVWLTFPKSAAQAAFVSLEVQGAP